MSQGRDMCKWVLQRGVDSSICLVFISSLTCKMFQYTLMMTSGSSFIKLFVCYIAKISGFSRGWLWVSKNKPQDIHQWALCWFLILSLTSRVSILNLKSNRLSGSIWDCFQFFSDKILENSAITFRIRSQIMRWWLCHSSAIPCFLTCFLSLLVPTWKIN